LDFFVFGLVSVSLSSPLSMSCICVCYFDSPYGLDLPQVGQPKVRVLRERLLAINPECAVSEVEKSAISVILSTNRLIFYSLKDFAIV
jgi:hypothetical protein